MKRRSKVLAKNYLVGIPIPYLDRHGRRLEASRTERWTHEALQELTECFGGATPIPAPGRNIVEGTVLHEEGQTLILGGCDDRDDFLRKRDRIQLFAEKMGHALNQYAVFVLAFPSDSFLIELTVIPKRRKKPVP